LHKSQHQLLRLLVENEITRLNVWLNPTNDPKRGTDFVGVEKTFYDVRVELLYARKRVNASPFQDTWIQMTQAAWKIDPAVAVHMAERFKANVVQQEVTRLVKANAKEAMDIPEALKFLLEGKISGIKAQLKVFLIFRRFPMISNAISSTFCYGRPFRQLMRSPTSDLTTKMIQLFCSMLTEC
jgi:phosphatidylinositol 4-kinase